MPTEAVDASKRMFLYNLKGRLARESEALSMQVMYVQRIEDLYETFFAKSESTLVLLFLLCIYACMDV